MEELESILGMDVKAEIDNILKIEKIYNRLDYLNTMLAIQLDLKKASVAYNDKDWSCCDSKERKIRTDRDKRIQKLQRRIKNCKKQLPSE